MSGAASPDPSAPGLPPDFLHRIGVTEARRADIETYRLMLAGANETMNLVGPSTMGDFQSRHFIDSAQLLWFSPDTLTWADLGSGAGLPGLVMAILLKGRPGARVHLVESMAKRCRFLSEVVEALDLPAEVHNARAESLKLKVEMVTARACAPLVRLLGYARPFLDRGARGLFMKGAEVEAEIAEARQSWRFSARMDVSLSDPRGRLLWIEELSRAQRR
jgi:16S rRNA (guanine527-N7)-methyltransferase